METSNSSFFIEKSFERNFIFYLSEKYTQIQKRKEEKEKYFFIFGFLDLKKKISSKKEPKKEKKQKKDFCIILKIQLQNL